MRQIRLIIRLGTMRKILSAMIMFALAISSNSANAILIVSGDLNITVSTNNNTFYQNAQFFENILEDGNQVGVLQGAIAVNPTTFADRFNDFYNGLADVTSTVLDGAVTASFLDNIDLFVAPRPLDQFATSEITALNDFYLAGGSIFFLGDYFGPNSPSGSTRNGYINEVLASLGSSLSIVDDLFGVLADPITGSGIASDPLTNGVSRFSYAAASQVAGGTPLFYGEDNKVLIAYEAGPSPVPEPSTLALLGIGLFGMGLARRRKA